MCSSAGSGKPLKNTGAGAARPAEERVCYSHNPSLLQGNDVKGEWDFVLTPLRYSLQNLHADIPTPAGGLNECRNGWPGISQH
jgi:hypothetical protein